LNATSLRFVLGLVLLGTLVSAAYGVTIATVPVGSSGNAADPATGSLYGAVPYNYRIGTYDVTNAQYLDFLAAKASAGDPFGLWNTNMDPNTDAQEGAIFRSGSGSFRYSLRPGFANKPVIYVSWYDAVRFANWLSNGQGNGDTESGTYTITGGGNNSGTVVVPSAAQRAAWASASPVHWLIPSESEWYKAAYYNAAAATYYAFPFQSNSQPAALAPPGTANSGNLSQAAFNSDGQGSDLSDVGAYRTALGPFGSFDMGGDALQWTDTVSGTSRIVRGSSWAVSPPDSGASTRFLPTAPTAENTVIGFRMASVGGVPEPASIILALLGLVGLLVFRKSGRVSVCRTIELGPINGR
jgi:sulfatase modifying factor 1